MPLLLPLVSTKKYIDIGIAIGIGMINTLVLLLALTFVKRPWDSRKLLRIVEIPRVDGVRACDEMIEYDYKFGYDITSIYFSELFLFSFLISDWLIFFLVTSLFGFFKILSIHKNGRFRESFSLS